MLILSIDTSTRGCSVAVHADGQLAASYDLLTDRSSSSMLTTLMKNAVEHAGYALTDLDAVAVAKGPGSYTGLRVSVSTAKGLCYALDKTLIAIETLAAMTAQITAYYPQGYLFCPMIDARRMEVFAAVYDTYLETVQPTRAVILDENSFADLLQESPVVFFGDGAAKSRPLLGTHPNAHFPNQLIEPSARTVGMLASKAYAAGRFEDLASFEPYYLKDFMGTTPRKKVV
ncbi:tRNA (adenosine(37)-N6)-threonylcarbamoyltransferase complex dimerization subunit type 1 TsaB [Salmonirosea aquatica]|uniref:tRNA (Adenosine(37)-N6)-threonylcarbamoyltransferase complex dimerization subunit type 1 TsaB n=1 Tax=Salmonirosea aquatica TaxID=2654236 RepID=A0A7C9F433_9BACT|nr:tRNA (adenosine(37)-N6)-threonylcarbamoyltransferase complex dimerization subunit type 1 TsaB [Cytophagaceae bacterium SJW1-29]